MKKVESYKYAWNVTDKTGHLRFKLEGSNWSNWKKISNAAEFQVLIDTLRNEAPVLAGIINGKYYFQTDVEPVGEGEF